MSEDTQPSNTSDEIYSNSRSKRLPPTEITDSERYSTSRPISGKQVSALPPLPLSQSLQRATTISEVNGRGHSAMNDVPTFADGRAPRRFRPFVVAAVIVVIVSALFVTYRSGLYSHRIANTQSDATTASFTAITTATAREPYHVVVPGNCNGNAGWSTFLQPSFPDSVQCLSDGLMLMAHATSDNNEVNEPPRTIFSETITVVHDDVALTVMHLSEGMCLFLIVNSALPLTMAVCHNGNWTIRSEPQVNDYAVGESTLSPQSITVFQPRNPQSFVFRLREDKMNAQALIDGTPIKTIVETGNPFSAEVEIVIGLTPLGNFPRSGSVNLQDFTYTPIFDSGA